MNLTGSVRRDAFLALISVLLITWLGYMPAVVLDFLYWTSMAIFVLFLLSFLFRSFTIPAGLMVAGLFGMAAINLIQFLPVLNMMLQFGFDALNNVPQPYWIALIFGCISIFLGNRQASQLSGWDD